MIKQPLFGQDSSPHITSMLISAIATLVCWIIFCVMCLVIKFKPAVPEYQEIQIVLNSTPVEEQSASAEQQSAMTEQESAVVEQQSAEFEQPVVPEPVEGPAVKEMSKETPAPAKAKTQAPAAKTPAKTEAPKTKEYTKVPEFTEYAKDYSDGVDFNQVQSKPKNFDWSQFDEVSSKSEPQVSQKVTTVSGSSGMQGSAASSATQQNQSQSSSQKKTQDTPQSASSVTNNMLSNIRNTQYSTSSGSNTKSITEAKTTKGVDGTLSMAMTDGSTRVLIEPIPPVIKLSESAASTIDSTRTVTIEFQVLASGNVPRAQIKITPESILPLTVREEIYDQLTSWIFEASSSSARATFEYTIQKR